mmetsp:Transcript_33465/g.57157  ORF Transcript_33465/g.57157 Transcript_33465/m.57157 type:complete len:871 (+) Transcript_33465:20-2632(+)
MKPRSGSGSVPDTKSSFPPPPVHLLNSDKRCSVGSRLPPINPLQKAKELGSPNFSLERSQSSGTLPLPLALLKKNPSLEKSIGSPDTPVAGVVASSFEEYYTETHGSKEEIDKKRIANNLKKVSSKITSLKEDLAKNDSDNSLIKSLQDIVSQLEQQTNDIKNCKDYDDELASIKSFFDFNKRTQEICDGLLNHSKPQKADPKEGDILIVLRKLIHDETSYTGELSLIQRFFRDAISKFITPREDVVLFSELETLLELHKKFLRDLRFTEKAFPAIGVGELLLFYSLKFSPYLNYTSNIEEASELLEKLLKNKDIRNCIRNLEKINNRQLSALLKLPLRKLDQYIIFSEQFYQLTAPKSEDRPKLEEVIENFQGLLDKSAKKANIADQLVKLQTIGMEIEDLNENLVTPDRQLVHEGPLRIKTDGGEKSGDYVFLFTDLIIFVQKKGTRRFQFVGKMGMHTITVQEDPSPTSFQLIQKTSPTSKKIEYILSVDDEKQKDEWFLHFSNVQRDVIRYRKVFGVHLKTLVKREKTTIPHFVEKSISFIREYGLKSEGIFRLSGRATQIEKLRDQLDQGKKVFFSQNMDVHSVANLFKQWLREMPEPILTWKLYDDFIAVDDLNEQEEKLKAIEFLLNVRLPKINRYCFQYMMKLLTEVVKNYDKTKLDAKNLSIVFAPNVLVNGDPNANPFSLKYEAVNRIFEVMITNYPRLFHPIEQERSGVPMLGIAQRRVTKKKLRRSMSVKLNQALSQDISNPLRSSEGPCSRAVSEPDSQTQAFQEGVLLQQEKNRWVERYFVLKPNGLYRFKAKQPDEKKKSRIPFSSILKISADPGLGKPFAFQIERSKKDNLILSASSHEELIGWITSLTRAKNV